MTRNLTKWDPVDYLDSEEAIDGYLREAFQSSDPQHIAGAIGDAMRAQRKLSLTARQTGLNRVGLTRSFSSSGDPKLSTLVKVMNSMGYRLEPTPIAHLAS